MSPFAEMPIAEGRPPRMVIPHLFSGRWPLTAGRLPSVAPGAKGGSPSFTLVELLTVIAIIGMLASLLFPSLKQMRERARSIECVNNLRQLGQAVQLYAGDYGQRMPVVEPLPSKPMSPPTPGALALISNLLSYVQNNKAVFRCPCDRPPTTSETNPNVPRWEENGQSYDWRYQYNNDFTDEPVSFVRVKPGDKATLMWDYDAVHRYQMDPKNVLYVDGHVN